MQRADVTLRSQNQFMEVMHPPALCGNARPKRARGFTLIELMVTVLIVGILGAVALPSFMNQIRKSRRAEAITEVYRVSQAEERFRASNTAYSSNLGTQPTTSALGLFPSTGAITTYNMASGYYSIGIGISSTSAVRYVITATTTGSMTSDTNCRTLVMDMNNGVIAYTSTTTGGATNAAQSQANLSCWNRG
jgi:type IV pilus assembly protein PilE